MERWRLRRNILQLLDSFHQGGSEGQAIQLTRLLHESGRFSVRLASLSPEGPLRSEVEKLGLAEIPSFPLNNFYDSNAVAQLRRLIGFLRESRIEILHTHDFYTNIFGMAAGSIARVPVRIASMRETAGMRTAAQKKAQQFAYWLAHHVIANSEAVRQRLISGGVSPDKITVVYNGLDPARMVSRMSRSDALALLRLPADAKGKRRQFVTILANMRHEVKDYPMFLRAAQRVRLAVPNAVFLLAGEGELSDSLHALAKELSIGDNTFFLGRCENVAELLYISEVCVLSSKAEGFSNSILEYMAAERPVVATDVGGAREAIVEGQTGYLIQSGDDEMMARRIILLLRESNHARTMGAEGRRVVEKKFSSAAQLQRTEELYHSLLAERHFERVPGGKGAKQGT